MKKIILGAWCALLVSVSVSAQGTGTVITPLQDINFQQVLAQKNAMPAVIIFGGANCQACTQLKNDLARSPNAAKLKYYFVETDDSNNAAENSSLVNLFQIDASLSMTSPEVVYFVGNAAIVIPHQITEASALIQLLQSKEFSDAKSTMATQTNQTSNPTPTQNQNLKPAAHPLSATGNATPLTGNNFKTALASNSGWVLVDESATWCGPCQQLKPVIEAVAEKMQKDHLAVYSLDADLGDSDPHFYLAGLTHQNQNAIPSVYLLHNGALISHFVGPQFDNEKSLEAYIKSFMK
jgi:thioredoxin 1